jgi:hypothetical protein
MKPQPKTIVKYFIDTEGEVLAVFPQLNYNKHLYGNTMKTGYAHIGQHAGVSKEYYKQLKPAKISQYHNLSNELFRIGYNLREPNNN